VTVLIALDRIDTAIDVGIIITGDRSVKTGIQALNSGSSKISLNRISKGKPIFRRLIAETNSYKSKEPPLSPWGETVIFSCGINREIGFSPSLDAIEIFAIFESTNV
jgi:hypothetical protein